MVSRKEDYRPLKRIIVEDKSQVDLKDIKKVLRPNLSNLLDRIKEINLLTGGSVNAATDPQSLLDDIIVRLTAIPYIPWPVSFSTVDMIGVKEIKDETGKINIHVLMGKKYGQTHWQFPGGFRDPKERNAEAASREYKEECCVEIAASRFRYIDDMFVDDRRYKLSPHKITTTMFLVHLMDDEVDLVKGGDDLEMVQWFPLDELREHKTEWIRDVHHRIFDFVFNNPDFV